MLGVVAEMAKSKAPKGRTADEPKREDPRQVVISMKGSAEFRDWLYELAEHERIKAVELLERAVVEYARNHGFTKIAPRRTGRG
jgi:hypothetical protein